MSRHSAPATIALLTALVLWGPVAIDHATAAGPASPPSSPAPHGSGHGSRVPGLSVVEALIEDLQFRGLLLYDREVRMRAQAPDKNRPAAGPRVATRITVTQHGGRAAQGPTVATSADRAGASAGPSGPRPAPATDLASFLAVLARTAPRPEVTGRFQDWRNPSVYRLAAGLHHGYDIAYGPHTAIVAGWPGRVTSILNWYGSEYGITVLSAGGFQTTYGHLSPRVHTGDWVNPGDIVGTVVNDHVDVKMRDLSGGFIDFARGIHGPGSGALAASTGRSPAHDANPDSVVIRVASTRNGGALMRPLPPGPAWTQDREAVAAAVAYLRCRHDEFTLLYQARATVAAESPTPSPRQMQALLTTRQRLESARQRLVGAHVPETVLLAALLENEDFRQARFASGEAGSAGIDSQDDAPRLLAMVQEAEAAVDDLRTLLRQLDTPAR